MIKAGILDPALRSNSVSSDHQYRRHIQVLSDLVAKSHFTAPVCVHFIWEPVQFLTHSNSSLAWRGKGISLRTVDEEMVFPEIKNTLDIFISFVPLSIDPLQSPPQIFLCAHEKISLRNKAVPDFPVRD
jgi:hypothetical protein